MPRIDPVSWQCLLLPFPKRFSRGRAFGFALGGAVGTSENARAKVAATWWRDGAPELLTLEGAESVNVGRAHGHLIPGNWTKGKGSRMGAAMWTVRNGATVGVDLHDPEFERTWATGSGADLVLGAGTVKGKVGQSAYDVGLVWRDGGDRVSIVDARGDVSLICSDGTRIGGSVSGRAALWNTLKATAIDLAPDTHPASEIYALDGDVQAGVAFSKLHARAGLWRGTADSFSDITPKGHEVGGIYGGARGFQVGLVRAKDTTRNGSASLADKASLWQGTADSWFDLNAFVPKPFNASAAGAITFVGERLWICGSAMRYEASDPGTPRESHYLPQAQAVLWTAQLI